MTGPDKESIGTTILRIWSRRCGFVERGRTFAERLAAGYRGRPAGLSPATRERVIDLIEADLACLVEDAREKPISEQSVEEMLQNREVLGWLRGGPLPGQRAVEILEENVSVFYQAPAVEEEANGKALRAALDELVRARAAAAGPPAGDREGEELTKRERLWFGRRLDELRTARGLSVGELSARSGLDVVGVVALIYGAEEARASEMMSLAAALEVVPRELFPECLTRADDEEAHDGCAGGPTGGEGGDA